MCRFYPEVDSGVIELFETTANDNAWIMAVAIDPDGG